MDNIMHFYSTFLIICLCLSQGKREFLFYRNKKTMICHMKKLNLLLLCLTLLCFYSSSTLFAQGWERSIGASGSTQGGISITTSTDGNYVITGSTHDGFGIDPDKESYLLKFDGNGNILWTEIYDLVEGRYDQPAEVITAADGGFVICGTAALFQSNSQGYVTKTDSNGIEEWIFATDTISSIGILAVTESSGGGYIFSGYETNADRDLLIGKIDASGNLLWQKVYDESLEDYGAALVETSTGEIVVTGQTDRGNSDDDALAFKADANGDKIWAVQLTSMYVAHSIYINANGLIDILGNGPRGDYLNRLDQDGNILLDANPQFDWISDSFGSAPTADGGYILTGWSLAAQGAPSSFAFMMKIDSFGNKEWQHQYEKSLGTWGYDVVQTPDKGYLMVGNEYEEIVETNIYLVKTDSLGRLFTDLVQGHIAHDTSMNCQIDAGELLLNNWIVEARKPGRSFYGSSDTSGYYNIEVDTGDYQIITHPPSAYWGVCTDSVPLTIANFFDTLSVDFEAQADIECPQMTVDLATPFLRRCFNNIYTVEYCNQGTIAADSAFVDIILDPFMSYVASSIPAQMQSIDTYRFQLGNIGIGECNTFNFTVLLDCDSTILGQSHCVEAHIYPDSLCLPISSNWSGAFIEIDGECRDSILNFKLENTGTGAMNGPLKYVIIEDAILLMTAPFELDAGASLDIPIPNNGSTYFLYAEQEPGAPGSSLPILSFEGCVPNPGLPFSTGFVNQFPQNDALPFLEIDCRQNIGAYDPNDKQAFPIGYGAQHLIEANTDIEYFIRFQNTGTDTAFTVVVQDTLSEWLDPASIQPGVGSHPYEFNLSKDGVIAFTFNNIMLPDSNVNQVASNGFVKFRIAQRKDNPIGTRIENSAAIFFDFNAPVITNTVFHTIGEDLIDIILDTENPELPLANQIKVYPNPFQESARFELGGLNINNAQFELYSSSGQLIRQHTFQGNSFTFQRDELPAGFYFFRIQHQGQLMGQGKVIVH